MSNIHSLFLYAHKSGGFPVKVGKISIAEVNGDYWILYVDDTFYRAFQKHELKCLGMLLLHMEPLLTTGWQELPGGLNAVLHIGSEIIIRKGTTEVTRIDLLEPSVKGTQEALERLFGAYPYNPTGGDS